MSVPPPPDKRIVDRERTRTADAATRSKRYSMIVENGKITKLNVEAKPGDVELSGAQACVVSL